MGSKFETQVCVTTAVSFILRQMMTLIMTLFVPRKRQLGVTVGQKKNSILKILIDSKFAVSSATNQLTRTYA